jgi:hypothetical protein
MPIIKRASGEILKGDLRAIAKRTVDDKEVLRAFFPISLERRELPPAVEGEPEPEKETATAAIRVVINTNDIDRHETIVDPTGADVNSYLKNPVLLYQHGCDPQVGDWVVGKTILGDFTRDAIDAELMFDLEGKLHGDANKKIGLELDRMYRNGWMRGVSIGFIARGYAIEDKDGHEVLRYTNWELVELSCVAVPSNPHALSEAVRSVTDPALLADLRAVEAEAAVVEVETREVEPVDADIKEAGGTLTVTLGGVTDIRELGERISDEIKRAQQRTGQGVIPVVVKVAGVDESHHVIDDADFSRVVKSLATLESEPDQQEREGFPVEWDAPYDLNAEFTAAATDNVRSAMSAIVLRDGAKVSYEFPHHHADGRLSWRMLATQMARLLTQPLRLTKEQLDETYRHLAEHYEELGVAAPEPGAKTAEQAYDLALQGRTAHLDAAGYAWMFVEAVERNGAKLPGFVRVDDDSATKLGALPKPGRLTDARQWGQRREVKLDKDEALLAELVQVQRDILDHQVRVGAKFSSSTRTQLNRLAETMEASAKAIDDGISGLREAATTLRSMIATDSAEAEKSVGGSHGNDGGSITKPANDATTKQANVRPILPRK